MAIAGKNVTVQAPEDFTGNVVVTYTVADKTNDKARWVDGSISLNVKGKPAEPSVPLVQEVKSKSVLLKWTTPVDNGSPITGYTVKRSDGATQECATNTCLITGLTNATPYTFTVSAKNAVGESAFSKASATATPDQQPDKPAAPTIMRGDTQLEVSWVTPVGEYSAVKSFNVEISPVPAGQNPQKTATGNKLTWPGLVNGTEYTFRVQAVNNAPKPSDWSEYSPKPVKPAGKPFTPAAPTTTLLDTLGNQNQVRVDWRQPNLNGGELQSYTLTTYLDGAAQKSTTTTEPTATVSLPNGTGSYTFRVVVATEVSPSDPSDASAGRRSVSKPGTVGPAVIAAANTGGAGGRVAVNFTPLSGAALGGSSAGEVSYFANVSTGASNVPVTPGQEVAAANGQNTTVTVYAKSSAFASAGDASAPSNAAVPFGNPGTPGLDGNNGGQDSQNVSYSWSFPGGATDTVSVQIRINGGGWSAKNGNGSDSFNTGGYDTTATIEARAINSVGTPGPVQTVTPKSGAKTPPVTRVRVQSGTWHSCTTNGNDGTFTDNPATCDGNVSPGGNKDLGGHWLDYADGWVTVDRCGDPWGNSGRSWYHMTSGPQDNRWVRADTVDKDGTSVGC